MPDASFRSGFVALVGRPNAGKSTLLNACCGKRLAIASPVAQTTRRRLRGVIRLPDRQLIIVDTPGLHKPKDALGKQLNRSALGALADVDVVAMLVDATKPVGTGDEWVAAHVERVHAPKLLVLTKADLASRPQVEAQLEAARTLASFDDALVTSATEGFNVDAFINLASERLPEGPAWFPDNMSCDASEHELVSEFVREKVLLLCHDEVPHSVAVTCDNISWATDGHASVSCTILVEREGQKGIVVGKGGSMVKRIGTAARRDVERLLGAKVYLELRVQVQPQWRRDANEIRRLGYEAKD